MNNPLDKVYLSQANLTTIAEGGSVVSGSDSYSADENAIYLVPDDSNVVQTTGQSSTDVMSQKAVTDELGDKADKVGGATSGNFAGLDSNGNLTDSGKKVSDFLGVSGILTIAVADWDNGEATKTVSSLGNYDLIQFFPATATDKTNATNADMWVSVSGTTITFTAQNTPSADITFNYFINRGTV